MGIYDKKSQRTGSLVDHVLYTNENPSESLEGTYYIGVYAYSFSTYTISAFVHRTNDEDPEIKKKRAVLLF